MVDWTSLGPYTCSSQLRMMLLVLLGRGSKVLVGCVELQSPAFLDILQLAEYPFATIFFPRSINNILICVH